MSGRCGFDDMIRTQNTSQRRAPSILLKWRPKAIHTMIAVLLILETAAVAFVLTVAAPLFLPKQAWAANDEAHTAAKMLANHGNTGVETGYATNAIGTFALDDGSLPVSHMVSADPACADHVVRSNPVAADHKPGILAQAPRSVTGPLVKVGAASMAPVLAVTACIVFIALILMMIWRRGKH